jgi:hypothetical protein
VGIFQISQTKRRQKRCARGDKKPAQIAQQTLHAPDAVSREYRGKNAVCKKYFTLRLSLSPESLASP